MKKNDKIIVVLGVIILILASIGIYYWVPEVAVKSVGANEFVGVTGNLKDMPSSIIVSDNGPFYPLIATPLAVNYDGGGKQTIIPMYVMNFENPSSAITKLQGQLDTGGVIEIIGDGESAKVASLRIAKNYWDSSEAALIIEYDEAGYNLGILATPLASYLRIPVIVTDKVDSDVTNVLSDLGVKETIICGENIDGYGNVLRFNSSDDIVNASIGIVEKKFKQNVDYITLANPVDAWPPQVLDSFNESFGPVTVKSGSTSQLGTMLLGAITGKGSVTWKFTIPKDYKYALVKFEGVNYDAEHADDMGDAASFNIGPNIKGAPSSLKNYELMVGSTAAGGVAERDSSGKIVKDVLYSESVAYGRGGVEYTIHGSGKWLAQKQGKISASITVEKLANPVYPMMKGLSSISPYLTAYHKGILFAKPEFAFTADDNVITDKGQTCPGIYVGGKNPSLVPLSNKHFFDKIHDPLNNLLAKLAGLTMKDDTDLKGLTEYYKINPVYIALVGDATVLPNYFYQSDASPIGDVNGDGVDDTNYYFGGGTPTDVLYGDVDPVRYDWSNLAGDVYSTYPYVENIVGRITGWDAQDADALVLRGIFYNQIVNNLEEWKDNFALMVGGGTDFQKPLIRYIIVSNILNKVPRGEPVKMFTGYAEMTYKRAADAIVKPLGFNLQGTLFEPGMLRGLSDDTLNKIKKSNLLNKLFFEKWQVRRLVGEGNVKGKEVMESSNFIFANGHGNQHLFGLAGNDIVASGLGGPLVKEFLLQTLILLKGGFLGPGTDLDAVGAYSTRSVSNLNLGPSFMWLESCICGKFDGLYQKESVGQSLLHAGIASLVASPTETNIGGGYLEPKNSKYNLPGQALLKYLLERPQWNKGIFPDPHFGERIYTDMCNDLKQNNVSVGLALRNARNSYLPEDASWLLWWSPPLTTTGDTLLDIQMAKNSYVDQSLLSKPGLMMESKYRSFQEYVLFGDPALNLYEPCNEGTK